MGSLGILFPPWLTKRRACLEGACPRPFPSFAATSSIAVSQLGGENRLKTPLCIAWFLEESCPHPFGVLGLFRKEICVFLEGGE